jgi:hypothetical protein
MGPFPEPEESRQTEDVDSDSEAEAENTEHVRKTSLPNQAKAAVKEVAKEAVNGVKKVSQHSSKDDMSAAWKNRSVFAVRV